MSLLLWFPFHFDDVFTLANRLSFSCLHHILRTNRRWKHEISMVVQKRMDSKRSPFWAALFISTKWNEGVSRKYPIHFISICIQIERNSLFCILPTFFHPNSKLQFIGASSFDGYECLRKSKSICSTDYRELCFPFVFLPIHYVCTELSTWNDWRIICEWFSACFNRNPFFCENYQGLCIYSIWASMDFFWELESRENLDIFVCILQKINVNWNTSTCWRDWRFRVSEEWSQVDHICTRFSPQNNWS